MRFTGHSSASPINAFSSHRQKSSYWPKSPSVTSTVDNTLILRLAGFDAECITTDYTGLSGHSVITADTSENRSYATSGAAGYVMQDSAGLSGNEYFQLWSKQQSVAVTLAIAGDGSTFAINSRLQVGSSSASTVHSGTRMVNNP